MVGTSVIVITGPAAFAPVAPATKTAPSATSATGAARNRTDLPARANRWRPPPMPPWNTGPGVRETSNLMVVARFTKALLNATGPPPRLAPPPDGGGPGVSRREPSHQGGRAAGRGGTPAGPRGAMPRTPSA